MDFKRYKDLLNNVADAKDRLKVAEESVVDEVANQVDLNINDFVKFTDSITGETVIAAIKSMKFAASKPLSVDVKLIEAVEIMDGVYKANKKEKVTFAGGVNQLTLVKKNS